MSMKLKSVTLCSLGFFFLSISFTGFVSASETSTEGSVANKIIDLIKSENYQQAFQLAQQNTLEFEGLVKFDYAYGLAAQKNNQHHEAIFAFERVLRRYPNQLACRYALAVSYYAVGNIIASEKEFRLLQSLDTKNRFPLLTQYLDKIKQQKNIPFGIWGHSVQVGVGVDSNANSGTDQDTIGGIVLDESSKELSDQYLSSQWQTSFVKPLSKVSSWYALARVKYHSYVEHGEMSRLYGDVLAGYKFKLANVNYHVNGYLRPMWLDGEHYVNYNGLAFDASYAFDKDIDFGAVANLASLTFENDILDKTQTMLSLWYEQSYLNMPHKVSFTFGNESSKEEERLDLGRSFYSVSYQTALELTATDIINAKLDYMQSEYDGVYLGAERSDQLIKLIVDYNKRLGADWSWLVKFSLTHNSSDNSSVHALYSYNRALVWTSAQYTF